MVERTVQARTQIDPRPRNDEGVSLIVALFGIVLLTVLGVGLTSLGTMATVSTVNERDAAETLAIADAGIAHARKLILWKEWPTLDVFLQNGGGTACDGDELADPPATAPAGYPAALADFIPAAGRPFGRGSYRVFVCDDHLTDVNLATGLLDVNPDADVNRRVLLRAVATGPNGATAAVELVIGAQDLPAVIVNGPLIVAGHPQINGAGGSVHANGDLSLDGNPCAHMYYSSVETVSISGNSVGSGATCSSANLDTRPDSPPLPIPEMDPDTYKAQATFWLEDNGTIYNGQTGAVIPSLPGWNWSNGQKRWSGGTNIAAGTYWVNANVSIGGSPGSPGSPLPLTILSKYSIDVSGNPDTVPHLMVSGPGMVPTGLSMLAGTDLEITGDSTQTINSIYYARHQVEIHGTPTINGQVLAANLADTPYPPGNTNLVVLNADGEMTISGTPTINFNGSGLVSTVPLSWRECRANPDPNNPCGPLWGGP
jgi:hypothetical protein